MEAIYSTKNINKNYYMEIGTDEGYAVLYVYKDGKLFDWHFSMNTNFETEMMNTISCYKTVHKDDPKMEDIITWRQWFKELQKRDIIG